MSEKTNLAAAADIAQFKFALVAPVVHDLFTESSRTEYYKRVTEKPLTFPDGSVKELSYKTIEKWVSLYNRGGIEALMPSGRSDKGTTRVLSDAAIEEIYRLKQEFPRLNATQIHAQLIRGGFIPATVSVCAVQRFIRANDLKSARNPNLRDRKAFEEDTFGNMWQTDTCYFPYITEDGKSRRTYAVCIIDDHSRYIVAGHLFYNDSAYNFQKVFKEAVAAHGIPLKLYTDNGASFSNEQLSLICGEVGTVLLHTKVRDGASKAKIERFWRSAKEQWVYTLNWEDFSSIKDADAAFQEFLRRYNLSVNSGIDCAPFDRYQKSRDRIKQPVSREWLDACFLNRVSRRVRKDATITIDNISYDVPMQFISQKVDIRYLPDGMEDAFILFDGERYPIRRTDKNENCRTKRNNPVPIDYSKMGGSTNV